LDISLNGFASTRTREIVLESMNFWGPMRSNWRASLIKGCKSWRWSEHLFNLFWRGLFDESASNQRAAISVIINHERDNEAVEGKLIALFENDPRPTVKL